MNKYFWIIVVLTVLAFVASVRYGAVQISSSEILHALQNATRNGQNLTLNERIFLDIRLPRAILALFAGATLAVGGTLMQGLLRNPIVEPGLIGTSSGAAFGAALYFVLGATFGFGAGTFALPLAACVGGILATFLVLFFAEGNQKGQTSTTALLLIGIAVNALFLSGVGFLSFIARDPQARSITFWNLGTLSGANWKAVGMVAATSIIGIFFSWRYAKQINALMLGETEAAHLGINVRTLKIKVLLINVVMVAVATAFTGIISFVGLIVPHLLRILLGSNNRTLIVAAAVAGALLLSLADLLARIMLSPAELPIGIVTTIVGAPVLIYLLRKSKYYF